MTTPNDPPGLVLCDYCSPRRSPVDGRVFRDCDWCRARDWPVWCECLYCEWIEETPMTQPDLPVDDDPEYNGEPDGDNNLPEPTDPAVIPADEGDPGSAG